MKKQNMRPYWAINDPYPTRSWGADVDLHQNTYQCSQSAAEFIAQYDDTLLSFAMVNNQHLWDVWYEVVDRPIASSALS